MEINDIIMYTIIAMLVLVLMYIVYDLFKWVYERKEITYDVIHECWYYIHDTKDSITICKPVKKVSSTYILFDQKCTGEDAFKTIKKEKLIEKHPKFKEAFLNSTLKGLDSLDDDWQEHYDGYMYKTVFVKK